MLKKLCARLLANSKKLASSQHKRSSFTVEKVLVFSLVFKLQFRSLKRANCALNLTIFEVSYDSSFFRLYYYPRVMGLEEQDKCIDPEYQRKLNMDLSSTFYPKGTICYKDPSASKYLKSQSTRHQSKTGKLKTGHLCFSKGF